MSGRRPPRWLERLLSLALPAGLSVQSTLGDLAEEFERRAVASPLRAYFWYAAQAISILSYRLLGRRDRADRVSRFDYRSELAWSIRSIVRRPLFSLAVVTVLGLGLGANVAVFSVVDGTLRNTTWWADPDGAVAIWPGKLFSLGQLQTFAQEQTAYRAIGGYAEAAFAIETPDGESESVNGVAITPELFRELAVQPELGRAFADDDAIIGVERVVVLSERVWRRSYGADPGVVGSRVVIGGVPATVIGIQGRGGSAPGGRADLWLPLVMDPRDDDYWKEHRYTLVGTLASTATLDDAAADLDAVTSGLSRTFPTFFPEDWAASARVSLAGEAQRRFVTTPLMLLLAGTALLMLVTALNVGNLLLGRAIERRAELALRASLGASRGRIVGQLLVEGMVLTALALAIGVTSASFGGRWLAGLFVQEAVVTSTGVLTPAVLAFSLGVAALAWLVLNGVSVAHFLRTHRSGFRVTPDSGRRTQSTLVVVQASLAMLLLVSATLLLSTVDNLRRVPLGFDPRGLLSIELSPPQDRVESVAAARNLYDGLSQRVSEIPGVASVGLTGWLPLREQAPATPINLEEAPVDPREAMTVPKHHVDGAFFRTLGVAASDGRLLGSEDRAAVVPRSVVINETLAQTLWPGEPAVGKRIAIDPHAWEDYLPIVGVVPDIRSGAITGPIGPALYVALAEGPTRDVTLVVRTAGGGSSSTLIPMVRRAVSDVDPLVPIRSVTDMESVVRAAYSTAWVMMGLLGVLAALASGLGAVGIYAVLAHHVSLHRKELAVRMALGAQPGTVVRGVVRAGIVLSTIGIAIGGAIAAGSNRLLESLLFEVSALAPAAFAAPALVLVLAAVIAAWIPAARAGRLPPADVLRND